MRVSVRCSRGQESQAFSVLDVKLLSTKTRPCAPPSVVDAADAGASSHDGRESSDVASDRVLGERIHRLFKVNVEEVAHTNCLTQIVPSQRRAEPNQCLGRFLLPEGVLECDGQHDTV